MMMLFGISGLCFTCVGVPLLYGCVHPAARRKALSRKLVDHYLRGFVHMLCRLRLMRLQINGLEHLKTAGQLIVANHPTLIDAVVLMACVPGLVPIAKRSLWANPCTLGAIWAADYAPNDHGALLLDACQQRLARGERLLLFPEGRRSTPGAPLHFGRGAAQLAVRTGVPIVPVTLSVQPLFLTRASRWWQAAPRCPDIHIQAYPAIDPNPFLARDRRYPQAARALTRHLHQFYAQELSASESTRT